MYLMKENLLSNHVRSSSDSTRRFYDILSVMRYHKGFGDGYYRVHKEAYEQGYSDANEGMLRLC